MMRMMRKMFKRIVSIVMALLVILGTAVYGGSVSAEEQTATTTFTINQNYIYNYILSMLFVNIIFFRFVSLFSFLFFIC